MMRPLHLLFILVLSSCTPAAKSLQQSDFVLPSDENIRITGRVLRTADSVEIYWSGTSVLMRFSGQELKAVMKDAHGKNYFNVVIDGDSVRPIQLDSVRKNYTLASGLQPGEHTVELIKRNEWDKGSTWFYGIELSEAKLLPLPPPNKRVIEFFGNSITAGYAIDDTTGGDSPDSLNTNNYYTYAARTARHFDADFYCTVKSGIGITVSWFPLIMPELYARLNPENPDSQWDFNSVTPQVVVINLLQNDSWLVNMPDHPSFKARFGNKAPDGKQIISAYKSFVKKIRDVYPSANIICALGSMDATKADSPWPGYVETAVKELNDKKIHTLFFPFTNKPGHPRRDDNEKMAEQLIRFIEEGNMFEG